MPIGSDINGIPADIMKALKNTEKWSVFKKMSPSHQNEWLKYIDEAKKMETRLKRINNMISAIRN